jgi:lipopolysaccharide transport system permease protein
MNENNEEMIQNDVNKPIYDSARLTNPFVDEIIGLKENLFILRRMIYTNFKTRYKRSYLGVVWSLLNPLLNMIVFVIIFSNLFRFDIPHYPLYILSGNMLFAFFSQSTSEAMIQIISNAPMLRRVYLPKTIYILSGIGINGINLILTFIPFFLIALIDHLKISWVIVMIIPAILLLVMFVVGVSLIVATITTYLNDFSQIWSVVITLWMYMTPIFYPATIVPAKYLGLYKLNPMYSYVTLFREPLLYQYISPFKVWFAGGFYAIFFLIFGWWFFTKNSNEFSYRA